MRSWHQDCRTVSAILFFFCHNHTIPLLIRQGGFCRDISQWVRAARAEVPIEAVAVIHRAPLCLKRPVRRVGKRHGPSGLKRR